jgi:radical SAM superfamily enzyme YgiQ (UPF0313 family)
MSHVALLSFSGLRVREPELAELGVQLPGLSARAAAIGQLPSLGLLTLAGMLPDEWTCSYREVSHVDHDLIQSIVRESPTLVAMSALSASVQQAYLLAGKLRGEGLQCALGGLHATTCPAEADAHFDAVCMGEGELVWLQILADARAGKLQPRYSAVRTANELPWPVPRFDLVADRPVVRWTIQTQRGCPLACEFCAASRLISRFREKPADQLRRELAAIRCHDPNPTLELADDNTFSGQCDPEPVLSALADTEARYFTEVDWRIGERPALVRAMAASGCVQVLVGIESLVFRYPGMGDKAAALDRVLAALAEIQDAGIAVIGCFIVGADGETRASLDRLLQFLRRIALADVQVTLNTPFPGTALRARLARQGRLLEDRDWSHYTLFDVTFRPDQLKVCELETGYRELLRSAFDEPETARRAAIRREVWQRNPVLRGRAWLPKPL